MVIYSESYLWFSSKYFFANIEIYQIRPTIIIIEISYIFLKCTKTIYHYTNLCFLNKFVHQILILYGICINADYTKIPNELELNTNAKLPHFVQLWLNCTELQFCLIFCLKCQIFQFNWFSWVAKMFRIAIKFQATQKRWHVMSDKDILFLMSLW